LDIDGDQQQDLLLAEAECRLLYLLPNDGTSTNPIINRSSAFPPGHLVNFVLFPAAYYEDVDFDGVKDLIASPSVFTREYLNSDFRNATWYYRNTGSNTNPAFSFVQSDFLQGEMIDVGDN